MKTKRRDASIRIAQSPRCSAIEQRRGVPALLQCAFLHAFRRPRMIILAVGLPYSPEPPQTQVRDLFYRRRAATRGHNRAKCVRDLS
jgi:hypothetical protein